MLSHINFAIQWLFYCGISIQTRPSQ